MLTIQFILSLLITNTIAIPTGGRGGGRHGHTRATVRAPVLLTNDRRARPPPINNNNNNNNKINKSNDHNHNNKAPTKAPFVFNPTAREFKMTPTVEKQDVYQQHFSTNHFPSPAPSTHETGAKRIPNHSEAQHLQPVSPKTKPTEGEQTISEEDVQRPAIFAYFDKPDTPEPEIKGSSYRGQAQYLQPIPTGTNIIEREQAIPKEEEGKKVDVQAAIDVKDTRMTAEQPQSVNSSVPAGSAESSSQADDKTAPWNPPVYIDQDLNDQPVISSILPQALNGEHLYSDQQFSDNDHTPLEVDPYSEELTDDEEFDYYSNCSFASDLCDENLSGRYKQDSSYSSADFGEPTSAAMLQYNYINGLETGGIQNTALHQASLVNVHTPIIHGSAISSPTDLYPDPAFGHKEARSTAPLVYQGAYTPASNPTLISDGLYSNLAIGSQGVRIIPTNYDLPNTNPLASGYTSISQQQGGTSTSPAYQNGPISTTQLAPETYSGALKIDIDNIRDQLHVSNQEIAKCHTLLQAYCKLLVPDGGFSDKTREHYLDVVCYLDKFFRGTWVNHAASLWPPLIDNRNVPNAFNPYSQTALYLKHEEAGHFRYAVTAHNRLLLTNYVEYMKQLTDLYAMATSWHSQITPQAREEVECNMNQLLYALYGQWHNLRSTWNEIREEWNQWTSHADRRIQVGSLHTRYFK